MTTDKGTHKMMQSITLAGKDMAELRENVFILARQMGMEQAEKTLKDFALQDIANYLAAHNVESEAPAATAAPAKKAAKAAKKEVEPETPAPAPEQTETPPVEAASDLSDKDTAIKKIMAAYTLPAGKKIANSLLKEFGVKNFHLIDDSRSAEFLQKTNAALTAAGI